MALLKMEAAFGETGEGRKRLPRLLVRYRNDNSCTLVYFTLTVTSICNLLEITDKQIASIQIFY